MKRLNFLSPENIGGLEETAVSGGRHGCFYDGPHRVQVEFIAMKS
jgi:hypothetical protein